MAAAGFGGCGAGGAVDVRQGEDEAGGVWKSDCESGDAGVVSASWVCGDGARTAGDGEDFGVGKVSGRRRRGLVRCGAGLLVKPLDLGVVRLRTDARSESLVSVRLLVLTVL